MNADFKVLFKKLLFRKKYKSSLNGLVEKFLLYFKKAKITIDWLMNLLWHFLWKFGGTHCFKKITPYLFDRVFCDFYSFKVIIEIGFVSQFRLVVTTFVGYFIYEIWRNTFLQNVKSANNTLRYHVSIKNCKFQHKFRLRLLLDVKCKLIEKIIL